MRERYGNDPTPTPGSRLDRLAKRHRAQRRKLLWTALAVAPIAALTVLAAREFDGAGTATLATKPGTTATALAEQQPASTAIAAAIVDCRVAWGLQSASRAAAKRSLAQWRVHIDAMNKLSAGKLTLDQATQFWAQSRTGAKANAAAFRASAKQYTTSPSQCEVPPEAGGDRLALVACQAAVAAGNKELSSAGASITTWETHIHHMEMLRAGQLDPTHALHLWLQNWQAGAAQVAAYDKATVRITCSL